MFTLSSWTTTLASIQWLFFIFTNTIVVPLSIGSAFGVPPDEMAGLIRNSLIFTGFACMLQGIWGHRFPLMEGHSGVMWGLVLNLSLSASSLGMSLSTIGGGMATGMLLAGVTIVLLGSLNLLSFVRKIFSPMVMSVYLFLLTIQLIIIFFNGMLEISADGSLNVPITLFSFGIAILVSLLKIKGNPIIGNFSILIGMVVGWILYLILFPSTTPSLGGNPSFFDFPIYPLGSPNLNVGIIIITFLACFVNMSNTIASIQAASSLLKEKMTERQLNRSYVLTGVYSMGASFLGLVSYAPYASSIGFLESTRIFDRKPFLIGGGLMAVLGLVPILGNLMATLPMSVGNAILFVAYLQLFGTSIKSLNGYEFNSITIHRLALPVLLGISIMNVDAGLFSNFPILLQPLVTNGFMMGVLLSIFLEIVIDWDREKEGKQDVA
ncbi:uracil/xanthine transporter [Ammoniphilus sp. YIM 78166]|uniref:uracil/xanthine transporter n=1 Tax=Ammoniphilus sp. YIM 78166 TaxID=1644106 RepID=UPI00107002F5|nr:uracil/xanthine transporter [Ammoniphilus sp. YIM 78166]